MAAGSTRIVLQGGPLDGSQRVVDVDATELEVAMVDDTRHRYRRTDITQNRNGKVLQVFVWTGRH